MKISYLKIDNFREVRSMDLRNLTAETILTGPNGAGKTTALDAIRAVWTGQCYDQGGKRIPCDDLIGPNGKTATIDMGVELEDGKPFSLFLTIKKGGTNLTAKDARAYEAFPGADTATKIRAAICEALGTDLSRIECALNPRAYLLGPELGNMLAELCGGSIDTNDVRRAAGDHWEYLERLASDMGVGFDSGDLSKIGETAYKRRTEVNKRIAINQKAIDDLGGIEQPTDTKGNPIGPDQLAPLTKLLNELQAQRDGLVSELGRTETLREAAGKREALEAALAKATEETEFLEQSAEKATAALTEFEPVIAAADTGLAQVEAAAGKAGLATKEAARALEALNTPDGLCPTCGEKLKAKLLKPLTDASAAASAEFEAMEASRVDARAKHAAIKGEHEALRQAHSEAKATLDDARATEARIAREIKALPDMGSIRSAEAINAEIATLDARCEAGRSKVEALGKWAERDRAYSNIAELQDEASHLEWIIAAFRDGEFMKSQLTGSKGAFEAACNAVLGPYGYSLAVEVNGKHVQVTMAKEGHRPAPLAQCSKGELVLAGWAVATAFAGDCPICLDDMDALYGKTKNVLLMSLKARESVSPVFIAGAWTAPNVDLEPIRGALPNASVVWVEDGAAKTQGAKVAA